MLTIIVALVVSIWLLTIARYWDSLSARWDEPVFRHPVLVLESDDWGAGPIEQVRVLRALAALLAEFRNAAGEHPVMTLGIVLAHPIGRAPDGSLSVETLLEDAQAAQREAICAGVSDGVFAPQLHGFIHTCEKALLNAARADPTVAAWLEPTGAHWTEELPSPLQSAWTDASILPSRALPLSDVKVLCARERELWERVFETPPTVVVPTTFVWTETVEQEWAAGGMRVVITPGRRYTKRGVHGEPAAPDRRMLNGERGYGDLIYLVRDLYFEPSLGHEAERLMKGVKARATLGRPALVEIHRFNFCGPRACSRGESLLREALTLVVRAIPNVRFTSSTRIAEAISMRDSDWLEESWSARLRVWLHRIREIHSFWLVARITGLAVPLTFARSIFR